MGETNTFERKQTDVMKVDCSNGACKKLNATKPKATMAPLAVLPSMRRPSASHTQQIQHAEQIVLNIDVCARTFMSARIRGQMQERSSTNVREHLWEQMEAHTRERKNESTHTNAHPKERTRYWSTNMRAQKCVALVVVVGAV